MIARSGIRNRQSSCEGKSAFKSHRIAKEAANRRKNRVVYRCDHCFQWHVGTPEPKLKVFMKRKKLIQLFLQPEWRLE